MRRKVYFQKRLMIVTQCLIIYFFIYSYITYNPLLNYSSYDFVLFAKYILTYFLSATLLIVTQNLFDIKSNKIKFSLMETAFIQVSFLILSSLLINPATYILAFYPLGENLFLHLAVLTFIPYLMVILRKIKTKIRA